MKKTTHYWLGILLSFISSLSFAQIENYYNFSESSDTYVALSGADETVLAPFTFYTMPIPFDFEYAGKRVPYIAFLSNGVLRIGGPLPQPNDLSRIGQESGATSIIAPLWDSQRVPFENTTAKRKTLLEGTSPNRTFTIEWENVIWNSVGSEISFRVIFEETTNNITFFYGPNASTETQSASIGLNTEFGSDLSFLSVTPGTTSTVSSSNANNSISTDQYPGEGKKYIFTYTPPICKTPYYLSANLATIAPTTAEILWTNTGDETLWDIMVTNQNDQTSTVVQATSNPFTLTDLNEDTKYSIAIRANCGGDERSDYSSLHFFTTPAVCPKPRSLTTENLALDSSDFTWAAGDEETSWEAAVVLSGEPEPNSGTVITTTNFNASGLTKDTDYVLYIRANCDSDGFSKWSSLDFRTLATCQIPTSIAVSNETCSTGEVSWTSNGSETSWEISVTQIGTDNESIIIADTNPYTVTNLDSGRTYRIRVRAICDIDDASRFSTFDFIRTLDDTTDPIPVAKNITLPINADGDSITITGSDIDNGSTDDCKIDTITVFPNSFDCSDIGENTVTLTVTDSRFNSATTTAIVIIQDQANPIARTQDITAELDASGTVIVSASDINNGSTDNCTISNITVSPNSFDCSDIGTPQSVSLTVTDSAGNTNSANAIVNVVDTANPIAIAKDFTAQLDASGNVVISASDVNNDSTDNCEVGTISVTPDSFNCTNIGNNTVTLTVTDAYGNSDSTQAVVRIEEMINPIAIAKDFTAQLDASGNVVISASDVNNDSTDNCGIDEISVFPNSFDCSHLETPQSVTLTVTDLSGNINTAIAMVSITDTEIPLANCVAAFSLQLDDTGMATITAEEINSGSTDNCSIANVSIDKSTFTSEDIGTNIITLSVTDFGGNVSNCTTTVTIEGPSVILEDYVTGLSTPRGLAFDKNGFLYIAEHFSGKIFKVTATETYEEFASTGFYNNNIAFDNNENLYTTDDFFSQIFKIDPNGTESVYLNSSNGTKSPWGIAFDNQGNLYYSTQFAGTIRKVTPDLQSSDFATELLSPEGIAFDSQDNLIVADRNDRKLIKISPDGTKETLLSGITDIRAIAIDKQDNIYFNIAVGPGSRVVKIVKYNPTDGSQNDIVSSGLTDVNELIFNAEGDLFIAQDDKIRVIRGVAEPNILSISESVENTSFVFYPNPVTDIMHFNENIESVKIYDISGTIILKGILLKNSIDISILNPGLYVIESRNKNGVASINKLIKK